MHSQKGDLSLSPTPLANELCVLCALYPLYPEQAQDYAIGTVETAPQF